VVNLGGAGAFFARALEELGADVVAAGQPEGLVNPYDPEAVAALSRAVLENEADLGVALDADGTRCAIVDQEGMPLTGNRMIALMAAILLEEHPGATFVTDSVTSSGVARFITEWGGVHYRFKRGHRNVIAEAMRLNEEDIDCPLAIETSGHAALRENFFLDDGVYLAAVVLCKALTLKRDGETISSLIEELAEPVESQEIRMRILAGDYRAAAQSAIETVLSHTLDNPEWRLASDNREGVRINFDLDGDMDNAWLLLRLSVNEKVMPLNVESDVPGGVKHILEELYELLKDYDELDLEPLRAALG
jgi:phosphomannomutase